jgi:hypothetical protein
MQFTQKGTLCISSLAGASVRQASGEVADTGSLILPAVRQLLFWISFWSGQSVHVQNQVSFGGTACTFQGYNS